MEEDKINQKLNEISKSQKETNDRLVMLMDKLVGDPLTKRKGWITIIEENSKGLTALTIELERQDKRLQAIEEKKSKVGSTILATISAGGSGSIITANWAAIKKAFIAFFSNI